MLPLMSFWIEESGHVLRPLFLCLPCQDYAHAENHQYWLQWHTCDWFDIHTCGGTLPKEE